MTVVHIDLRGPDGVPATGSILLSPTLRRHIEEGMEDFIILPSSFIVQLTDGKVDVELDPTGPDWAWSIIERAKTGIRRYVVVPDVTEVNYGDLIDVDPSTLDPSATPEAAWWAAIENAVFSTTINAIVGPITQSAYDALPSHPATTLYIII